MVALHKTWNGERIPSIVFTKGGGLWLEALADTGADGLGLDWTIDIGKARARVGDRGSAGQSRPNDFTGRAWPWRVRLKKVLRSFVQPIPATSLIWATGINQFTPPENVSVLVDTVHRLVARCAPAAKPVA